MSGGVDSAVAAQLAAERGDDVVAVTLELWADPAVDTTRSCCSSQAVARRSRARARDGHPAPDARPPRAVRRAGRRATSSPSTAPAARPTRACAATGCSASTRCSTWPTGSAPRGSRPVTTRASSTTATARVLALRARPDEGPDVHARRAAGRRGSSASGSRSGELTKLEVRELARRARPARGRQARQPGPVLPRRRRRQGGLPAPARGGPRRGGSRRARSSIPAAASSAATRASATSRSASGAASASRARSRSTSSTRTPAAGACEWGRGARSARTGSPCARADLHRPAAAVDRVKLRYRSDPLAGCVAERLAPGRHPRLTLELAEPAEGVAPGQTACLMQGDRIVGWGVIGAGRSAHAA